MEIKNTSRLPDEIIEEILSRVAVKSLLRFRCVSKTWHSTIDSNRFIRKHMQYSTRCSGRRVILASESGKLWQCSASSISNKPEFDSELKFGGSIRSISLVGCCAGVVCILLNGKRYMLWNPSTRISKKLPPPPPPPGRWRWRPYGYGFCYDKRSRDYKVVHISGGVNLNPRPVKVYSSKSNSWEEKSDPWKDRHGSVACAGQGKSARGKLHWVCSHLESSDIIAFDVSRGVEGDSVKKPEHDAVGLMRRRLGKLGECLSLVCSYGDRFDVWVMKEYAVRESWQKVMKVGHHYQHVNLHPAPLCIGPQGEITFLENGSFFICYRDGWSKRIDKSNASFQAAHIYFETLLKF